MARLVIGSYVEYKLWETIDIPYYKVFVQLVGKDSKLDGEMVFNKEEGDINFRWMNPEQLDEIDERWDYSLTKEVKEYLKKKVM